MNFVEVVGEKVRQPIRNIRVSGLQTQYSLGELSRILIREEVWLSVWSAVLSDLQVWAQTTREFTHEFR